MKIFILYFAFLAATTYGQGINNRTWRRYHRKKFENHETYLTLLAGENTLFNNNPRGQLDVSFPYSATSKNGTYQDIFDARVTNPYSKNLSALTLDFQVGSKNHFLDFDLAAGRSIGYFSVGYGRNANGSNDYSKHRFKIKPSINIGFYEFDNSVGRIDAQSEIVTVFDQTIDSTFKASAGRHSSVRTRNLKYITVEYLQHDFIINPKIAVEYHPFKTPFFMEFTLSYFLPFSETAKIRLKESDGKVSAAIGNFSLNTQTLTTTFNNKRIGNTPFSFSGIQVGLKIGF